MVLQEMPIMEGYETARRLREMGVTAPIIALTANAMAEQQDEFIAAGADAVLTKPAEASVLLKLLASFGVKGT
jgi:CheY-like chemotaxis protein